MDVIANNIANVNTVGFKSQRAIFADSFYQRIQGASGPDPLTGRAGTNPQQIGLGLNMASIDNIMNQGATQRTDNALDLIITGPGFFIVDIPGSGTAFTRAGNISMDRENNLHINGMNLMGWSTTLNETTGLHEVNRSLLQPLNLGGDKQNMPAEATTVTEIVGNLDSTQLDANDMAHRNLNIFDSLGNRYQLNVSFTFLRANSEAAQSPQGYWLKSFEMGTIWRTGPDAPWTLETLSNPAPAGAETETGVLAFIEGDRTRPAVLDLSIPFNDASMAAVPPANWGTNEAIIGFSSTGAVTGIIEATRDAAGDLVLPTPGLPMVVGDSGIGNWIAGQNFAMRVRPIAGVAPSATFGDAGLSTYPPPAPPANIPVGAVNIRMTQLFQRAGGTNVRVLPVNGARPGTLQDISIGGDGTIVGRYSNGNTRILGLVPLAMFSNPAGLERAGANLWFETANSGPFDGLGESGSMQGGALEMSNVDLANEFTEMITTQRGFQAASRTISVSDELLQELVNLRR